MSDASGPEKLFDQEMLIEHDGEQALLQGRIDRISIHPEKGSQKVERE